MCSVHAFKIKNDTIVRQLRPCASVAIDCTAHGRGWRSLRMYGGPQFSISFDVRVTFVVHDATGSRGIEAERKIAAPNSQNEGLNVQLTLTFLGSPAWDRNQSSSTQPPSAAVVQDAPPQP